ncbi:MAG: fluoride efflux transporter CrcB [Bacteroidota bacterium]
MRIWLLVGAGGFIGSVLRYLASQLIQNRCLSLFPLGTFGVNILGCFVIGVIFGCSLKGNMTPEWRFFLATGICGGFTTFSTFSNETIGLLRNGQVGYAFLYIAASVIVGLLATFLGITLIKLF